MYPTSGTNTTVRYDVYDEALGSDRDFQKLNLKISGYTTLKNAGGTLKLVGVNKRIDQIFMVTKLHTIFEAFEEEASALASF